MLSFLRKHLAIIVAAAALAAVPLLVPATATSQDIGAGLECGAGFTLTDDLTGCEPADTGTGQIQGIIETVINVLSVIVAVVAVIMIIWGGFKYITSGGDSGNITTAKNTIIYAIIGLVIVALAQFIVQFVIDVVVE